MGIKQLHVRAFDYDVKAVAEDGAFTGYASVFGVVDSYNEVVAPGAFAESLADLNAKGRGLPILWQHRTGEPIGNWNMAELKEDGAGLSGAGELWLEESNYARIAYRGMKSRAITGLSIGYYVRDSSMDQKTGIRTLKALDLVEISVVTNPANDEARIDAIKEKICRGGYPTLREFELLLREEGFSNGAAGVIVRHGYKHLLSRGDAAGGLNDDAMAALRGFNLAK